MHSYRPNVAAIFTRPDGCILICERFKTAGAWQFPQGGIDSAEDAEQALKREVQEETGYRPDQYDIIERKGPYRYLYPADVLVQKLARHPEYKGQEQEYFLCLLHDGEAAPELDCRPGKQEFSCYQWIQPCEFQLSWLPEFKKEVYKQVFKDFFNIELT